ncbi:hypothetical protein AC249_AIPGENE28645, partial [Exaiptasia diaphana]
MYDPRDDKQIKIYNSEGVGIRSMSRILGYSPATIIRRILYLASNITKPIYCENNQVYEVDEMWTYVGKNDPSSYSWITYAINRRTNSVIDVAFGSRNKASARYSGKPALLIPIGKGTPKNPIDVLSNNYRYDQLQRIKAMDVYEDPDVMDNNHFNGANLFREANGQSAYRTRYSFDKNGNLKTLERNGSGKAGDGSTIALPMDQFTYSYYQDPAYNYTNPSGSSDAQGSVITKSNRLATV